MLENISGLNMQVGQAISQAQFYWQQGDLMNAEKIFLEVEPLCNSNIPVIFQFVDLFIQLGNYTKAKQMLNYCLKQESKNSVLNTKLGDVLGMQGKYKKAIRYYQTALKVEPRSAIIWNNLGLVYRAIGDFRKCNFAFVNALKQEPSNSTFIARTAECFFQLNDINKAKSTITKALKLDRNNLVAHEVLKSLCGQLNPELSTDETFYQFLKYLFPEEVDNHVKLSHYYEKLNKLEKAKEVISEAIQLIPDNDYLHLIYAQIHRRMDEPQLAMAELQQLDFAKFSLAQKRMYYFEKAHHFNRSKDEQNALNNFELGNSTAKAMWLEENKNNRKSDLSPLIKTYTKNWVSGWQKDTNWADSSSHVFYIGFPRSGTTLVERILNKHSAIVTLSEEYTFSSLLDKLAVDGKQYPQSLQFIDKGYALELRDEYLAKVKVLAPDNSLVIDKMPLRTMHIGLLHQLFPNAKFIFSLRHPYDVCLSCYMQNFVLNNHMAHFLSLEDTGKFYSQIFDLYQQYQDIFMLDIHTVKYENLIINFDFVVNGILNYLGLEREEELEQFYKNNSDIAVNTPSYSQVSKPLYKEVEHRWKRYPTAVKILEPLVGKYLDKFNY